MIGTAPVVLARARSAVRAPLEEAVSRLSPGLRRVVAYQLGWADRLGRPVEASTGKALRPALALLSARAVGAPEEVALPGAAAVELVHNFSLLHDDVMDGDRERRHRLSAWAAFGVGEAIVAGDALVVLALDVLDGIGGRRGVEAAARLRAATAEMIAGQVEDLALEAAPEAGLDRCLAMASAKTGALLSCSAAIGAVLAEADGAEVEALAAFGRHLGLAFQAADDLLGIWGSPEETGKPVGADLRRHKKTLPVALALERAGARRDELAELLARDPMTDRDVAAASAAIEDAGGKAATLELAAGELARARAALQAEAFEHEAVEQLLELLAFAAGRRA